MLSLDGSKALVTGAGVRIGRALALGLAREGCDVAVHYATSRGEAEEVVAEILRGGRRAVALQADFRQADTPRQLARRAVEFFGGLDILINSASVYPDADRLEAEHSILNESLADWETALGVNARAPFFLIQHLADALRRSRNGNIVNILDASVSDVFCSRASHTVSKRALAAVTELAARTLAPCVRVNALELGAILPGEGMSEAERARLAWTGTDEVVRVLIGMLASPGICGRTIRVGTRAPISDR